MDLMDVLVPLIVVILGWLIVVWLLWDGKRTKTVAGETIEASGPVAAAPPPPSAPAEDAGCTCQWITGPMWDYLISGPCDACVNIQKALHAEEMMRIAKVMSDTDIAGLRAIHDAFPTPLESDQGKISQFNVLQQFRSAVMPHLRGSQRQILRTCLKLESYGLVGRVEDRSKNNQTDEPLAFGLLQKGKDFIECIRSAATDEDEK
jgi:hypothetical protein